MRITVLFFSLLTALFALSDNYKIIVGVYPTKSEAQQAYLHYKADPQNLLFSYINEQEFIIHTRQAGNKYVIAIEPFPSAKSAEKILRQLSPFYPNAFISRGIANDMDSLLAEHRNNLINQNRTLTQSTPTIVYPKKTIPILHTTSPKYERWGFIFIVAAFILYLVWRERIVRGLRNHNQLLLREKEEVQNAMQAKNDFIAMINHEIRAPINAVMGISHLLLESDLTLSQRSQILKIKDATAILHTLVNDILDHSKIEAGKITIEEIPFDLNTMLDNISNIITHKADEKHLELIFDIDKSVPNKLIGDPLRVLQILVNLLNNALKFTENGSVILRLRGEQSTALNVKIHFEIIDTGFGMAPESLKQLFTSYLQADETTSRKYDSTGLGLTISKNLISLMGGSIQAKSTPNQGSTFSFDINFYSDSAFEKRRYRLPTTELMSKNGLIVESNLISAEVLKRGLEYFHYEIKIVTNLVDAMEILKNHFIDIVFIDTHLVLSGEFKKELLNRINNENLKLVWMGDDLKKREGIILPKPYNQLRIFNVILLAYGHLDQEK